MAVAASQTACTTADPRSRALLVYFSRPGENYYYGDRIDLEVGNTEVVARKIQRLLGCDSHRIVEADPYPHDYDATVSRNVQEQEQEARPRIAGALPDLRDYDVILLGSPIWNVRPPRIVHSFLDGVDLAGKTIHPFTTHAMSGLGDALDEYAAACPDSTIADGLAVQGEEARQSDDLIRDWLRAGPPHLKETPMETLTLNNGVQLPALGFGVFQTPPDETHDAVLSALEHGYRHIDTAAAYANESGVGRAVTDSGLDRSEVFLESKVWISDYGYDATRHAFDKSAAKLGVEQIDLFILHQALPGRFDLTLEAYRALESLLEEGRVRAIGVSNFMVDHLQRLLEATSVVPAVNQIEVHPYFQQPEVRAFGAAHGILTQAWSPIGGITFYREGEHRSTLEDPTITDIASAHDKSPAQVMLRWHLQQGRSVIPKSTKPHRIAENIDVFDFQLTGGELAAIDALDTGVRGGPEPEAVTLEDFGRDIPEA